MLSPDTLLQNRYLILRLLARGGMGAVYEARDERLGNIVALKETLFVDEAMRMAFHREASILATLRHQALPKVIDHFTEGDGQFLVMEYIRGEDLSMILRLNGSPIPMVDALAWADQALAALEYLHSQRPPVIHRDIKPQNLKLNERGEVILLDFGLAKEAALDTTRPPRSVRGYTLNYAPLEQIQGTGTDPRSDLYSLAATFYHLMTGAVPPNAVVRATALIEGREDPLRPAHELNPRISPAVSHALERALTLDRNHRPASAAALRAELRQSARAQAAQASSAETRVQPAVNRTSPVAAAPVTQPYWSVPAANSNNFELEADKPRKSRTWVWIACAAAVAIAAISSVTPFSWNRTNGTGPVASPVSTKTNPNPSPEAPKGNLISSHVILGDGSESNRDHSFIAEPGEFKLTLDVLSKWGNGSSVTVEAIGENGLLRFAGEKTKLSLSSDGEHEQAVARLVVEREQLVRLRVTKGKNLEAFRLRIDGSATLKDEAAPGAEKSTLAALFANRDRPLPLVSNAVFTGPGGKRESYYAFTAGPGEIKLTLNVIGDGTTISAEIFNDEAERLPFADGEQRFMVSSSQQNNEEESSYLSIERRKKFLLRIHNAAPQKTQAFRVRIGGPVQLANRNETNSATQASEEIKKLFAPRDSPEALTSKEISDRAIGRESYFTFAAGPGTVRLNLEVEANGSTLKVELFDSQSKRLRFNDISPVFSLSSDGKKVKKSSEIRLGREENLLMRLSANPPDSLNKFRLKLDGAVKKR
jgi:serine/threonine protein kinase